jgi:hypothetical protein
MKKLPIIIVSASVLLLGMFVFLNTNDKESNLIIDTTYNQQSLNNNLPSISMNDSNEKELTEKQLLYLIEEEKLAHDVYRVMYEQYGSKIFGNILESESTHQDKVFTLMKDLKISDPRSSEIGVFKNNELQKLYDDLITQGMQNETEAIKVGIAIEEKDIADISNQLATTSDENVVAVLEILRSGSENHLRAFNRQI